MKQIRWIWRFWQPHRAWLWLMLLLTLVSSAVALGYPYVLRFVIDMLQKALSQNRQDLATATAVKAIWMIAVLGLARSSANMYPAVRAMVNSKLEMDIRETYFAQILTKSHKFFQHFRTGDLVTRLTDDIGGFPKIAWFCCSGVFRAVESASKFIFCIAFMLSMNWQLTLITIAPLPLMLFIFYHLRTQLGQRALQRQQVMSRTNDALEAAFSGVRILKAFRGEANQAQQFRKILDDRVQIELAVTRLWMGVANLYQGIQYVGQIIVVVAGGLMVISGKLTLGEFYAFYVYLSLMLAPLMDIPNLFVTSRQAFACIDREIEIEETDPQPALAAASVGEPLTAITKLELRDVSFSYDVGLPLSLRNISLTLSAGQRAAVVGMVGCGKSTLIKLAAGIFSPTAGEVLVNGRPLRGFAQADLRSHVGYIPQEATLFSESVRDNVAFGRQVAPEMVLLSLELARVREEMEALPGGVDQVLGQRGLTVSGGQKQRLAIARALAGAPDLLLMDDCTSALDAENERAFWELFRERFPQAMCLIVTHRLATARQADVIYMLHKGRIVGAGTHAELVESCPQYRSFLTREELEAALAMAV